MAKVLNVGQCGFDHAAISSLLRDMGVTVERATSHKKAQSALSKENYDLVLVNRVNDRDGSSGIEFIKTIKQCEQMEACKMMLVSNYADAQEQAVSEGALMGFGKNNLRTSETLELLRAAIFPVEAA